MTNDNDDKVLNLVKAKDPEKPTETEAATKEEEKDKEKCDAKMSELAKTEAHDDKVKKEREQDDDDTLSESETTAAAAGTLATAVTHNEAGRKPTQKVDAEDEMNESAVPSPEVCLLLTHSIDSVLCWLCSFYNRMALT